ncbi:MAG: hypothetical protein ACK51S_10135, partial [Alphaproteobacteria bacterium]
VVGAGVRSRHQCNAVSLTPSIQIIVMAASRGSANRPPREHGLPPRCGAPSDYGEALRGRQHGLQIFWVAGSRYRATRP